MRNIIISFLIFILMMVGIFFSLNYLNDVSLEILSLSQSIEEHIVDDNWDLAYKGSIELLDRWSEGSKIISMFTNDSDIHGINDEIVKLTQFIKMKTKDEALVTIHLVKYFINHITDMQYMNSENIF